MNIPCDKRVDCCPGLPLSNYSSEEPDRFLYLSAYFVGPEGPPSAPVSFGTNEGCTSFSSSMMTQQDADNCAARQAAVCASDAQIEDPCIACRPADQTDNFGFFSATTTDQSGVCCNPGDPEGCCCTPETANPDIPPGGSGPPPGTPPPPTPRLFCNEPQTCEVWCADGRKSQGTVGRCQVYAYSTQLANSIAHSMACEEAEKKLICYDDWSGGASRCKVFCKDQAADFQMEATAADGSNIGYEVVGGDLPNGLSMDANGHITGTPTTLGESSAQVKLTDGAGNTATQTFCAKVMAVTTSSLPNGVICSDYGGSLSSDGGYAPYTYVVSSGSLPLGLTLNSDGTITGQPRVPGTFGFGVTATDSAGNSCVKTGLQITVTGISSQEQTVYCPTAPQISLTVPAGLFVPCGPYAGYSQDSLNALATMYAANQLSSSCACGNLVNSVPHTGNHLVTWGCSFKVFVVAPGVWGGASYTVFPGTEDLYAKINALESFPNWCVAGTSSAYNGYYEFYNDTDHTKLLFTMDIWTPCPPGHY